MLRLPSVCAIIRATLRTFEVGLIGDTFPDDTVRAVLVSGVFVSIGSAIPHVFRLVSTSAVGLVCVFSLIGSDRIAHALIVIPLLTVAIEYPVAHILLRIGARVTGSFGSSVVYV